MDDVAPDRPLGHRGSPFAPYEVDVRAVGPGRPDDRMAVAEAEALAEAAVEVGSPEVGTPRETIHPVDTEPVWPGRPADGRSPYVTTCPFFRAQAPDGTLLSPIEAGDPNNRCAAFGEPQPQSRRQQELVCLESGHINCPRYLRGALIASKAQSPRRTLTRATRPNSPHVDLVRGVWRAAVPERPVRGCVVHGPSRVPSMDRCPL